MSRSPPTLRELARTNAGIVALVLFFFLALYSILIAQQLFFVIWLAVAVLPLYLLYRFVLAFERIADAAQRFAAVRERESPSEERP
ncbi:glycerol ABC transporter substrate-binding protein [Haloprofundus halophilus]|uniref:glycerol ABC transporter substrate-binding protein n=1 Tax=Haloprofundus halophilus TaxID=2283527 RepID=UPI000E44E960|nr:glycerol ABC transporter substrate-binding protein [Haloprofundus halophilus]